MDKKDMVDGVHRRLVQEVEEETASRASTADELIRKLASRSQGERDMLMKLPRTH